MNKYTKFAIGVLIQWYEVEMVSEYFHTLAAAVEDYSSENVIIDVTVVAQTQLEKPLHQSGEFSIDSCVKRIHKSLKRELGDVRVVSRTMTDFNYKEDRQPTYTIHTIADYRREFNERYCDEVNLLVWGESDMLVPRQMFTALDLMHSSSNVTKYVATFGICKMFDASWKVLEHPKFTDRPFIENDYKNWWSLKYTMNEEEMNDFNSDVDELSISKVSPFKFNGCGLVISSEIIRAGVNIPRSVFFVHEDTAFQVMLQKILPHTPQYHIKNILLVHNRNHPKKRMYVNEGEASTLNQRRRTNEWYVKANRFSEENCYNIFTPNFKPKTWKDVFKKEE